MQPILNTLRARLTAPLAVAALALGLAGSAAAFEPVGTKSVVATLADGSRQVIGSVQFKPTSGGSASFTLSMNHEVLSDYFLSMREFKCLSGPTELNCYVPYPYANPRTVSPGNYAWLEHSLLFFYKLPAEFGAKLWNGLYFEFRPSGATLIGKPQAVDLNAIGAPPSDLAKPPFSRAMRDDIAPGARWLTGLSIE